MRVLGLVEEINHVSESLVQEGYQGTPCRLLQVDQRVVSSKFQNAFHLSNLLKLNPPAITRAGDEPLKIRHLTLLASGGRRTRFMNRAPTATAPATNASFRLLPASARSAATAVTKVIAIVDSALIVILVCSFAMPTLSFTRMFLGSTR